LANQVIIASTLPKELRLVKPDEIDRYTAEFEAFHARFAQVFVRSEPREASRQYLRGLLAPVARKNCWQMAEAMGQRNPQAMQRLLFGAEWDADAVRDELQAFVIERFGEADGIGIVDETGFLKKGTKSVGVKRQYCGTAGKIENCQVGVFLTYCSRRGYTFLDRRLYLPEEEWCQDGERRREARVPEQVVFQTKSQLAIQMLEHAWARGVPMAWLTGDEIYGDDTKVRDRVALARKKYVLAVSANTPVWRESQPIVMPLQGARGRPRKEPRLADGATPWEPVSKVIAALPFQAWKRLAVGQGEKGPRLYDWARVRIFEKRGAVPGPQGWLLARRSIADPTELAYYLSNAPRSASLRALAEVAGARWSIETTIEEGKGEVGLDEYEVRYWHSWHRHITLSLMAHAFLASIRQPVGEKSPGPGDGRTECARGPAPAGDCAAIATPQSRIASGLVPMASRKTTTSSPLPLPQARRFLAPKWHP
jgi:SRSO17 transposase